MGRAEARKRSEIPRRGETAEAEATARAGVAEEAGGAGESDVRAASTSAIEDVGDGATCCQEAHSATPQTVGRGRAGTDFTSQGLQVTATAKKKPSFLASLGPRTMKPGSAQRRRAE